MGGQGAKNTVNNMANGAANITKAGMKMATGVATIGLDNAECGI